MVTKLQTPSPADINQLISNIRWKEGRKTLKEVCIGEGPRDWENTIKPISEIHENINRIWGAANHLCSVADNQEIRGVINKNLEQVSSFWTDFSQNKTLYKIFANLRRSISKKPILSNIKFCVTTFAILSLQEHI